MLKTATRTADMGSPTDRLTAVARSLLGSPVRRARRELQWRTGRADFAVVRACEPLPHVVANHSTPLFRPLMGLDERLQRNKVVNLRLAADRLDGVVLLPGQRLSFWREVGKPSARRGFVEGLVLDHGMLTAGIGGGLCQMTNLLYWMTLHTPLTVVERWRHSYDVFPDASRTQPFGSGATCAWPALDLQIENTTTVSHRLTVAVTDTHLAGAWTAEEPSGASYRIEERAHRIAHDGPGTYLRCNELWRVEIGRPADGGRASEGACTTDGAQAETLVATNRALLMYEPFLPAGPEG